MFLMTELGLLFLYFALIACCCIGTLWSRSWLVQFSWWHIAVYIALSCFHFKLSNVDPNSDQVYPQIHKGDNSAADEQWIPDCRATTDLWKQGRKNQHKPGSVVMNTGNKQRPKIQSSHSHTNLAAHTPTHTTVERKTQKARGAEGKQEENTMSGKGPPGLCDEVWASSQSFNSGGNSN